MELAAIWVNRAIGKVNKDGYLCTCRVMPDDLVKVNGNALDYMSSLDTPTHKVLGCFGLPDSSSLEFVLVDLYTQELIVINAFKEPYL